MGPGLFTDRGGWQGKVSDLSLFFSVLISLPALCQTSAELNKSHASEWPLLCLQILMSNREWAGFGTCCDVFPQIWAQCVTTMLYFQAPTKMSNVTCLLLLLFCYSASEKLNSKTFVLREDVQVFFSVTPFIFPSGYVQFEGPPSLR